MQIKKKLGLEGCKNRKEETGRRNEV